MARNAPASTDQTQASEEADIRGLPPATARAIVLALILISIAAHTWRAYCKYRAGLPLLDDGIFAHMMWKLTHGHGLGTPLESHMAEQLSLSHFAFHTQPLLYLFAPLYRLWPHPLLLDAIQAAVASAGAWLVYLLARDHLRHRGWACLLAASYLVHPILLGVRRGFHPVVLTGTILLAALYADRRGRPWAALGLCVLAMCCKESIPLITFTYAIYLLAKRRWRLQAALLAGVSVAWFAAAIWIITPAFRGEPYQYTHRYARLGDNFGEVALTCLTSPHLAAQQAAHPAKLRYVADLVGAAGLLPLAGPAELAIGLPVLAQGLLSANARDFTLWLHPYDSTQLLPFLYLAALSGLGRILRRWPRPGGRACAVLLGAATLWGWCVLGGSAIHPYRVRSWAEPLRHISRHIPPRASVWAEGRAWVAMSRREGLYPFPLEEYEPLAEYALVGGIKWEWPGTPTTSARARKRLPQWGFELVRTEGPWELWRRAPASPGAEEDT